MGWYANGDDEGRGMQAKMITSMKTTVLMMLMLILMTKNPGARTQKDECPPKYPLP